MGNTESSSSTPSSSCGPLFLAPLLLLPRNKDNAPLVVDANPAKQPSLVMVQDDPSEVTFETWMEDNSSRSSSTASTTTITIHKHHDTRPPPPPPREDEQPQVPLQSPLAAAKLEQAHERIQQLERLRQDDQELVRTLNAKLKHLLQVHADYYLALDEQDEQDFESE